MKRILVSLLSLLLTFSLLMPISANDDNASSNIDKPQVSEPTESEEVPSDVNKTPSNTNESGQPNDGGAEDNEDGSSTLACDVNQGAVACVGDVGYKTFEKAIQEVNDNQGTEELTLTIIQSGEYPGFQLTRDNVVIKGETEGVIFVKPETNYDGVYGGAISIDSDGALIENVTFKAENFTDWSFVHVKKDVAFKDCAFISENSSTTALMYNQYGSEKGKAINLSIENCSFENFNEGLRTCGDATALGNFTIKNNIFNNVEKIINVYFGVGSENLNQPNLIIENNTFSNTSGKTSFIAIEDYSQYQEFISNNEPTLNYGSALNVSMNHNTYKGDIKIHAIQFDLLHETTTNFDEESKSRVIYNNLVEFEGDAIESVSVKKNDGTSFDDYEKSEGRFLKYSEVNGKNLYNL